MVQGFNKLNHYGKRWRGQGFILERWVMAVKNEEIIKKILKHLGLWEVKPRPPPRRVNETPKPIEPHIDYSVSQIPESDNWLYIDPEYPEAYPA